MTWQMDFQANTFKHGAVIKVFESLEDGKDWLRQNAPDLLDAPVWEMHKDDYHQWGTNNRYAAFTRLVP